MMPVDIVDIAVIQNVQYKIDIPLTCVDEAGGSDTIKVFVGSNSSCVPLISALVSMPISEAPQ